MRFLHTHKTSGPWTLRSSIIKPEHAATLLWEICVLWRDAFHKNSLNPSFATAHVTLNNSNCTLYNPCVFWETRVKSCQALHVTLKLILIQKKLSRWIGEENWFLHSAAKFCFSSDIHSYQGLEMKMFQIKIFLELPCEVIITQEPSCMKHFPAAPSELHSVRRSSFQTQHAEDANPCADRTSSSVRLITPFHQLRNAFLCWEELYIW